MQPSNPVKPVAKSAAKDAANKDTKKTPFKKKVVPKEEPSKTRSTLAKSGPPTSPEKYYVKASILKEMIQDSYNTGVCSPELGNALLRIGEGLGRLRNFAEYSYKDEMIGDAVMNMWRAIHEKKYKLESTFSPFSYLTAIAYNSFLTRIQKEKRYQQTIREVQEQQFEELINDPELGHLVNIYVESHATKGESE